MTLLGIINSQLHKRLGLVLRHEVEDKPPWRPWYRGHHIRGTWKIEESKKWFPVS